MIATILGYFIVCVLAFFGIAAGISAVKTNDAQLAMGAALFIFIAFLFAKFTGV